MGKPSGSREGATRNADWSRIMIDCFPLESLTPDDRRIRAKWACRLAIAYGAALVVLLAFLAASRMIAGPASEIADVATPQVVERVPTSTARQRN